MDNVDDNNPPEANIEIFNPAEEIDYQKLLEESIENINIRLTNQVKFNYRLLVWDLDRDAMN